MNAVTSRMTQVALWIVGSAVILFGASGRLDWIWAWVYVGICVAIVLFNAVVLLPTRRDVVAERAGAGEGAKTWDKWLGGAASLASLVFGLLVAGLDARFGRTRPLHLRTHLLGAAGLVAGYALFTWAMTANPFFSTVVRIQKDRGHTVVDAGPYLAVRHPGYVGWLVTALAAPILLGSAWALLPAVVGCALMVVRTALEDLTLRRELPGYTDYAQRVRYRLVPGVW